MKYRRSLLSATLVLALAPCALKAQAVLVDWDQTWNYLHPIAGALPRTSGTSPHPAGTTPWHAVQSEFEASYSGPSFSASAPGFEGGQGNAPFGYGTIDYMGNPIPSPGEFSSFGTLLPAPPSGSRYTNYFRTTFTVPDDGTAYTSPVLRYVLDDGGFVYLNGQLILQVNMGVGIRDAYITLANGTLDTETQLREAELDLASGSLTGGNTFSGLPGNATVSRQLAELPPGEHTLAVAVHSATNDSSDMLLAIQLQAGEPKCTMETTVSNILQNDGGTPGNPGDDTISFSIKVNATGEFGTAWKVNNPTSGAHDAGGNYGDDVTISGLSVAEFTGGSLTLSLEDADDPLCATSVTITPPLAIASDLRSGSNVPVNTDPGIDSSGWVINGLERTMTMNNPGGAVRRITSELLDLGTSREILFSGVLQIDDSSSGTEDADSFNAYLILDEDPNNTISLITPHDTLVADGILTGAELAPSPGSYTLEMATTIPSAASSVQLVIEALNNSNSEIFTVRDLVFSRPEGSGPKMPLGVKRVGNNLVFSWPSGSGLLYNLRSTAANPAEDPLNWPIFGENSSIAATPPENTLTVSLPADQTRLFVIESFPAPPEAVYTTNFEAGADQWETGSDGAEGTAWELGSPTSGPFEAFSPDNCFATNLNSDYSFDADVYLRSPPIDLSGVGGATVKFMHYYDIEPPDSVAPFTVYDFGKVSIVDATDNSELAVLIPTLTDFIDDWELSTHAIPAEALDRTVKIEFRLTTDDVAVFAGWYIDDFEVTVP